MQWLRWYAGTVSDPKFLVVARKSGQNVAAVIAVWAMLLERALEDSRTQPNATERGMVDGFDCESSDAVLGLDEGATQYIIDAMGEKDLLVDWKIVNWEKRQPKREDGSAERAKAWREKQKTNATERNRTQSNARGEERRVEESREENKTLVPIGTCPQQAVDQCPHQAIVDLYHEVLPELPRVKSWNEKRQKHLRARWRERVDRQNLDFWKRYFEYVRKSPFLMGQRNSPGRAPFVCTLEWLVTQSNFTNVIEEKYHSER